MASHVQESPVSCCPLASTEGEWKNLGYEAQRKQADKSRPVNPLIEERSPLHLADSIFSGADGALKEFARSNPPRQRGSRTRRSGGF